MFIQDVTESQQSYLDTARNEIFQIYTKLLAAGNFAPGDLRFGLTVFRDHPPQDDTLLVQTFDFTSDVGSLASNLASFSATGGGDAPDAQSDALSAALQAKWNPKATQVMVLITDSPPHGIGEDDDTFPKGSPLQIDPCHVAKRMEYGGTTLYVIACEPTMSSSFKRALEFYRGLAERTGGKVVNLGDSNALPILIAGSVLEAVDAEGLVAQYQADIRSKAKDQKIDASQISQKLHSDLSAAGVQHYTLAVENMYQKHEQGEQNVRIWFNAENLDEAKGKIKEVEGSRLLEKYVAGGVLSPTVSKQPVETVVHKSLVRSEA
ncbi:hypothetical protein L208DRAFT_1377521 [Tricholoma matsutake]|nr:hypothetical protein L208DRAFT_1377521 [Tricholoma matsutake 945]